MVPYGHAAVSLLPPRKLLAGLIQDNVHKGIVASQDPADLPVGIQLQHQPLIHKPAKGLGYALDGWLPVLLELGNRRSDHLPDFLPGVGRLAVWRPLPSRRRAGGPSSAISLTRPWGTTIMERGIR